MANTPGMRRSSLEAYEERCGLHSFPGYCEGSLSNRDGLSHFGQISYRFEIIEGSSNHGVWVRADEHFIGVK